MLVASSNDCIKDRKENGFKRLRNNRAAGYIYVNKAKPKYRFTYRLLRNTQGNTMNCFLFIVLTSIT